MDNKKNQIGESPKIIEAIKAEGREILPAQSDKSDKRPNIIIGTLNIVVNPAKQRYQRFYQPQNNKVWYLHLAVDLSIVAIILLLTAFNVWLATHRPDGSISNYYASGNGQNNSSNQNSERPNLILSLKPGEQTLSPGDNFSFIISYKNSGKASAKNAMIILDLSGEFWQGKNKIVWSGNELPRLKEIKAGESGEIRFEGKLAKSFQAQAESQTRFVLLAQAETQYEADGLADKLSSISNKELIRISTDFKVQAFSRYYSSEGEQLGRGPLPPAVGEQTKLWIFFSAETPYNAVDEILVTANLADNATLTGNMSATSEKGIEFNPNNRQISWRLSRLEAPSNFFPKIGSAFEISLTPQADQIGKTAKILSDIKVSGTDSFTGKKFNYSLEDVTSKTADGKSNGIVIKK